MLTDFATFKLTLEILEALDKNQYALGFFFCDLANIIDYINHDILLQKLYFHVLDNITLKWFQSHLSGTVDPKVI